MSVVNAGQIGLCGIDFTLNSDGEFTLTTISTGGPATNVTWTRFSTTVSRGTKTVLENPVSAQYTHTLTVIGRLEGPYTCTVSNNVSTTKSTFHVQGKQ